MFDRITYISDDSCHIKLQENAEITMNLMNLHLVFEDSTKKILGEVDDMDGGIVKARFLGEIVGDRLVGGTIRKPSLDAKIRIIDKSEIPLITGADVKGFMKLGVSPFYDDFPVYLDVNNFFSNHFAIFGNTGSGKSCGVSRLFQNMFQDQRLNPYKANIVIFDSSAEYYNAFSNLNQINGNYNYRFYSTNEVEGLGEKLRLPVYLLNKDDLALLLQCTSHSQLPIIERMLKLALVFSQNDVDANAYKNHLIAKAIMTILYTNETAPNKRNEIFSILASCSTDEFNLEAPVQGVGYVRKFRECFLIDNSGNFTESVLLTEYVDSFIKDEYDDYEPHTGVYYDLNTLERALNFTLISEGWLRNEQTYGDSVTIRVRLHALIVGDNAKYFDVPDYVSLESYLSSMLINEGRKYQIVNINLSDIDDDFAKVLTKIYSRLIFDFSKSLKDRGSIPFHLILEEAHRYIQSDHDRFLFGYNIFERIAKEGRKYGVILGIITQRPVELSDNVISQCTNFLIFKINHPMDIDYIRKTIPHITDDIIEKQKALQAGTCLGFGLGFRIPLIIKMEMPNPSPLSSNCDVVNIWNGTGKVPAPAPNISNNIINNNSMNPSSNIVSNQAVNTNGIQVSPSNSNTSNANNEALNSNNNNITLTSMNTNAGGSFVNSNSLVSFDNNALSSEKFDDSFVIHDKEGNNDNTDTPVFVNIQKDDEANASQTSGSIETNNTFNSLDNNLVSGTNNDSNSGNNDLILGDIPSGDLMNKLVSAEKEEEEEPTAVSEIAEVNINSQGMLDSSKSEPTISLTDDDDDDNSDFEPDFS